MNDTRGFLHLGTWVKMAEGVGYTAVKVNETETSVTYHAKDEGGRSWGFFTQPKASAGEPGWFPAYGNLQNF